jgi:Putative peptidoglycan binding domain
MKRILYSVCIGSLALALTAWGQQVNDKRPERAKTHRTANVRATKPANTGAAMAGRHNTATAPNRQRSYATPRTGSNAVANQNARMRANREQNLARNQARRERNVASTQELRTRNNVAVNRDRNVAVNRRKNADVNRYRNADESRARNNVAVNRERSVPVNRTSNVDVNRYHAANEFRTRNSVAVNRERNAAVNQARNVEINRARGTEQFRARNNVAINRNRNFAVNQTGNFVFYRGGNVRINNDFHSAAFRGQRYAVFRNYHRQWHDRAWWRSHYNRIVFVNGGWYYWNAGYWFPAWGYDTNVYYPYDGPIYGYNGLTPDQVIVDVQEQLQRDGYYNGPIDGILGPMTREAIAAFQADNGLAITSVIDEPTLATLGVS